MRHTFLSSLTRRVTVFFAVATLCFPALRAQTFETATEAVTNMKVGWNLGNTLDSHDASVSDPAITEKLRSQPLTQPALMQMLSEAGFGAVRVPVTWYPHMDSSGNVDAAWMARVKQVVDYVLDQGMYCIINVHHDGHHGGSTFPGNPWIKASMANWTDNHARFESLWTQIANAFIDYDERLIFEGYNELLDSYNSWNYASYACEDKYDAEVAADAYAAINAYAQSFVTAVRATGGNNAQRNLIVKTYASCAARGTWSPYITHPLSKMVMPTDAAEDHLILGVHAYPRIVEDNGNPRSWDADLNSQFNNLNIFKTTNNVPVVLTEWGTQNGDNDYKAVRSHFLDFAADFITRCKNAGIAAFYWMGLTDWTFRAMPAFNQPDLAETILNAYYDGSYASLLPVRDDYDISYAFTYKRYGQVVLLHDSISLSDFTGIEVNFPTKPGGTRFRLTFYYNGTTTEVGVGAVTTRTFNFSEILSPTPDKIASITLKQNTTASAAFNVSSIYLIKTDGTKEELIPTLPYNDTDPKSDIAVNATPRFANVRISAAQFASLYYSDKAFVIPSGIGAFAYKLEGGRLVCVKPYDAGDILPQATGVILYSETPGHYKFPYTTEAGEAPVGSMMRGTDTEATTTGGDIYYKLSLNRNNDLGTAGFYYGAPSGTAFTNGAHKAYLAAPASSALTSRYYFVDAIDGGLATAIASSLTAPHPTAGWHTLDGRVLNAPHTTPGIYITRGRKVIIGGAHH